jgi:hypothetical protein
LNKYKLLITSQDFHGVNFIENIAKYSMKGAVIDKTVHLFNDYPHSCVMLIETEEFLKSEPSVEVVIVKEEWTKESLEAMDWDTLRATCKTRGITGRDRDQIIRKFLEVEV